MVLWAWYGLLLVAFPIGRKMGRRLKCCAPSEPAIGPPAAEVELDRLGKPWPTKAAMPQTQTNPLAHCDFSPMDVHAGLSAGGDLMGSGSEVASVEGSGSE